MKKDDTARLAGFADTVIWRGLLLMEENGVPFATMMDRMLTAAAAQIAAQDGADHAAQVFRDLADNIDAGAMRRLRRATLN